MEKLNQMSLTTAILVIAATLIFFWLSHRLSTRVNSNKVKALIEDYANKNGSETYEAKDLNQKIESACAYNHSKEIRIFDAIGLRLKGSESFVAFFSGRWILADSLGVGFFHSNRAIENEEFEFTTGFSNSERAQMLSGLPFSLDEDKHLIRSRIKDIDITEYHELLKILDENHCVHFESFSSGCLAFFDSPDSDRSLKEIFLFASNTFEFIIRSRGH